MRTVPSDPRVANSPPRGRNAGDQLVAVCPARVAPGSPVAAFQSLTLVSPDVVASQRLSALTARPVMGALCACRTSRLWSAIAWR